MDQIKIGKFIADMRRAQGMTQKQLADLLSVTDKTISKWETGNRLPDASILLKLSSVLRVDVNELLAGEKFLSQEFSSQEYMQKSESNIVGLVRKLNDIEPRSKSKNIGMAAGTLLTCAAFLYLFVFSLRMGRFLDLFELPTLLYLLGIKFTIMSISGWFHDYLNAWKICFSLKKLSGEEGELSLQAVQYAGALTLTLGGLIFFLGLFSMMNYRNDSEPIWPALAQSALTLLYTAVGKIVYVILEFRMKRVICNSYP